MSLMTVCPSPERTIESRAALTDSLTDSETELCVPSATVPETNVSVSETS